MYIAEAVLQASVADEDAELEVDETDRTVVEDDTVKVEKV